MRKAVKEDERVLALGGYGMLTHVKTKELANQRIRSNRRFR
jgi:hypothetical protein